MSPFWPAAAYFDRYASWTPLAAVASMIRGSERPSAS